MWHLHCDQELCAEHGAVKIVVMPYSRETSARLHDDLHNRPEELIPDEPGSVAVLVVAGVLGPLVRAQDLLLRLFPAGPGRALD